MKFPIGVIIDSFRTDIPTAVKKAAKVGAQGIQVYATSGEMSPRSLSARSARISANSLRTTDSLSPLSAAISAAASATKRRTPGESRSRRG